MVNWRAGRQAGSPASRAGSQPSILPAPALPAPPQVANRGGAPLKKWGRSSAASTAVSIADHLRALYTPTPAGDCFSTAVYAAGNPYGIDEDLVFSMPCRSKGDGDYEIIADFVVDDWLKAKLKVGGRAGGRAGGWAGVFWGAVGWVDGRSGGVGCWENGARQRSSDLLPNGTTIITLPAPHLHPRLPTPTPLHKHPLPSPLPCPPPLQESEEELLKERDCVGHLIPGASRAVCEIVEDTMLPGERAGGGGPPTCRGVRGGAGCFVEAGMCC